MRRSEFRTPGGLAVYECERTIGGWMKSGPHSRVQEIKSCVVESNIFHWSAGGIEVWLAKAEWKTYRRGNEDAAQKERQRTDYSTRNGISWKYLSVTKTNTAESETPEEGEKQEDRHVAFHEVPSTADLVGVGGEARQEGDGVIMGRGTREGAINSEVGGVGGGPDTISAARCTSAAGEGGRRLGAAVGGARDRSARCTKNGEGFREGEARLGVKSKHGNTATDVYGARESAINSALEEQPEKMRCIEGAFRVSLLATGVLVVHGSPLPENSTAMNKYVGLRWFDSTSGHDCVRLYFFSRRQPSRIQDSLDDT
ncbi:hypothetical protein B0H13DRAFT_1927090 [Mycena leptocephala]|nr:hypothetical protein B0H13DRAFT_1927090 [Mycena leptocephala]